MKTPQVKAIKGMTPLGIKTTVTNASNWRRPKAALTPDEDDGIGVDNSPPESIKSGYSVFSPTMPRIVTKPTIKETPVKTPKNSTTEDQAEANFTKQEAAQKAAQAKIAAKAVKLEAAAAKKEASVAIKAAKKEAITAKALIKADRDEASNVAKAAAIEDKAIAKQAKVDARAQFLLDNPGMRSSSMLALVERAKSGAYIKSVSGQLRSVNPLADLLDGVSVDDVIRLAKEVLNISENPYTKLNTGQQSMNFRNRMRGALAKGTLTLDMIAEVIRIEGYDHKDDYLAAAAAAKATKKATAEAAAAKAIAKANKPAKEAVAA